MKLIQITEAAARLGISRQTLENWGKNGTLRIRTMGKTGNAHWVDADTIDALGDTMQEVAHAREMLVKELSDIQAEYRIEHETLRDLRREVFMANKFKQGIDNREFYQSIPAMLHEIDILNKREAQIMHKVIAGQDIGWIAEEFGLTRARIGQIFYKGCRKARELIGIKEQLEELKQLRTEMEEMKASMKVMSKDLKIQQIAEQELQDKTEAERIEIIKQTDSMLKLLSTRLVDCDLTVRSLNCLKAADLETIGDLCKCLKTDLLKFRNFGKKSLIELDDFLTDLNLCFGMDVDKIYRERIAQRLREEEIPQFSNS